MGTKWMGRQHVHQLLPQSGSSWHVRVLSTAGQAKSTDWLLRVSMHANHFLTGEATGVHAPSQLWFRRFSPSRSCEGLCTPNTESEQECTACTHPPTAASPSQEATPAAWALAATAQAKLPQYASAYSTILTQ